MNLESCDSCKFYIRGISRCVRYPPQPVVTGFKGNGHVTYAFSTSKSNNWCGEWKKGDNK